MTTTTEQQNLRALPLRDLVLGTLAFVSQMGYEAIPKKVFFRVFHVLTDETPEQLPFEDFEYFGSEGTYSKALENVLVPLEVSLFEERALFLDKDQAAWILGELQSSHGKEVVGAVKELAERFCFHFTSALESEFVQIDDWVQIKLSAPIGWWISQDLFGEWDDRGVPIQDFEMRNYRYFLEHVESLADLCRGLRMLCPFADDALYVAESMTERRFQAFRRFVPESETKKRIPKDFFTLILPEDFLDGLMVSERFLTPLGVSLIRIIEIESKKQSLRSYKVRCLT